MSPREIKVSIAGVNLESLVSVLYFPVKNFKGLSMGENLKKDFIWKTSLLSFSTSIKKWFKSYVSFIFLIENLLFKLIEL